MTSLETYSLPVYLYLQWEKLNYLSVSLVNLLIVSYCFRLLNLVFSKFFPKWASHCFQGMNGFSIFRFIYFLEDKIMLVSEWIII
jgi:hypothetical protein